MDITQEIKNVAEQNYKENKEVIDRKFNLFDQEVRQYLNTNLENIKIAQEEWKEYLIQIRKIRAASFFIITLLMIFETIFLFIIIILSSINKIVIDNVTLDIIVGATLSQVGIMMAVIIRSVFPASLKDIIMNPAINPEELIKSIIQTRNK
jgi:hypothetical protein